MYYDLENEIDNQRFDKRIEYLKKKKAKINLTEYFPKRTIQQNKYLHLLLTWFAIERGHTVDYVKDEYFKKTANKDTFVREITDTLTGEQTKILRSSSDISTKEMSDCIERFRNWAADTAGVYLPEANEDKFLTYIQNESERYRQYI
jgi:hypothetical protein